MAAPAILLVHGYTGSPDDMTPLAHGLRRRLGNAAVHTVRLPGHDTGRIPEFDAPIFEKAIANALDQCAQEGRPVILVGHSTGGCLALGAMKDDQTVPDLVILAATPARITGEDLERWNNHRRHRASVPLTSVAKMVSYINKIGRSPTKHPFPAIVLLGESDTLVPSSTARWWKTERFAGPARRILIPEAGHHLFSGAGSDIALDVICRAVSDLMRQPAPVEMEAAAAIGTVDPRASAFLASRKERICHLARSPAGLRAMGRPASLAPMVETDPMRLTIEITSRCNLNCPHCARHHRRRTGKDMAPADVERLLDLLPNTFQVVLVGLGEPSLHPQLPRIVALAGESGRSVSLVTNATALDRNLSIQLIRAGLHAITFSLDSVDAAIAARLRPGGDITRIIRNIQEFTDLSAGRIPSAVFTAVSTHNAGHLPELARIVAQLGVNAWMLTDMNFASNQPISLQQNKQQGHEYTIGIALREAFSQNLPVLSVRGVEELALQARYHDHLITTPAAVAGRSKTRQWCLSPWQTLPVDVDGYVTLCDCQPDRRVGNLFRAPFKKIWNGKAMQNQRRSMLSENPPKACRICPRF